MVEKVMRVGRGYLISLAAFALMTVFGALLMKATPFPESWGFYYVVAAMSISCLFIGVYISGYFQKAGLLVGLCCSTVLVISILAIVSACFSQFLNVSALKPGYLIPLGVGTIGGIMGANMKK